MSSAAFAEERLAAQATGKISGDYARISFDWPERVRFASRTSGNKLILTFDKPTDASVGGILQSLNSVVKKAEKSKDGKTFVFTLDRPYKTRTFMNGTAAGVDLLEIKAPAAKPEEKSEKPKVTAPKESKKISAKKEAAKKEAAKKEAAKKEAAKKLAAAQKAKQIKTAQKPSAKPEKSSVATAAEAKPVVKQTATTTTTQEPAPTTVAASNNTAAPVPVAAAQPAPALSAPSPVLEPSRPSAATPAASNPTAASSTTPAVATRADIKSPTSQNSPPAATTAAPSTQTPPAATTQPAVPAQAAVAPTSQTAAAAGTATATAPASSASPIPAQQKPESIATATAPASAKPSNTVALAPAATAPAAQASPAPSTTPPEAKPAAVSSTASTKPEAPKAPPAPLPASARPDSITPVSTTKPDAPIATPPAIATLPAGPSIRFPMADRTAAAVFSRQNVLWVAFNKPVAMDMAALQKSLPPALVSVERLPSDRFTILRFAQKAPVFPYVYKEPNNSDWNIIFANRPTRPKERIRISMYTEPPLKPHIVLPILETTDSISVKDPVVGDTIQITPIFRSSAGFTPERNFVEFELLQTAQGVAVIPYADTTRITQQRNGLKITTAQGVSLSSDLPKLAMDELPDTAITGGPTLYPYALWKLKDPNGFAKEKQRLYAQMSTSKSDNANYARLKLLQTFLSEGLHSEALGLANEIREQDPAFYASEKISAYRGAANFMMYRLQEAQRDFESPDLSDVPEIDLWKNAIGEMQGDTSKKFDFMAYNDSYISKYPPAFRQKLAIIGGDLSINRKEYNSALKIFDSLSKDKILEPIQPFVDFMIGKISAETGQIEVAVTLWESLTKRVKDNFIRARAEFSLVNLLLQQGKITRTEAIARLDRLRIVWRGDGLELNVLLLLGNLQMDEKNWAEALRAYRDVVTNFPNVPEAVPTAQKMAETFNYLYNEGGAEKMKPLDALALFYEFRELTPIEADGDKMIRNLADRLVSVDLLDRAAALLENQIKFRLQKEERSRVGARLALIYLLNRDPKLALNTLEQTGYGQNPPELQRTRNLIAASALTAIGDHKHALEVIESDLTPDGQKARLGIYWNAKDWANVIVSAEGILSSRNDPSQPLDSSETEALLKLATAYVFQRDIAQLNYLRDYFTPLLKDNPQAGTFAFIANGSEPVDYRDLNKLNKEISSIQDYMSSFKNRVATNGLSSTVQ